MTDGRLGAAHARSGAGKALFFGNGEEGLELVKVHNECYRTEGPFRYEYYLCKCKELQICFIVTILRN